MSTRSISGWQDVHAEVLRRLRTRRWKPGDLLPNEADLAAEFGCARSTVNRALQAVADEGLLERRRRGGTRVLVHPERKATFSIPVIRLQIEQRGGAYDYRLLERRRARPPARVRKLMAVTADARLLHVRALHRADGEPWVLEDRWIDTKVVPQAESVDFKQRSPNEWLVENVPFSSGDLDLSATTSTAVEAAAFDCEPGSALFANERLTRDAHGAAITWVRLLYAPGYRMRVEL